MRKRIIKILKRVPFLNRKKMIIFFTVMGPGIITATVDNDAGGITIYSVAGAHYGYNFLWTLVPIFIALVVIQEMCVRMGIITGKGLADLIRERFGVRMTFLLMLLLVITNLTNTMAEFAGVAASAEILGVPKYISVPLSAFFVWILVVKGTYKSVEKAFLIACFFYVAYIISGFMGKPPWGEAVKNVFVPSFEIKSDYILMFIGMVGTTIAPWMQFYQQSSIAEKGIRVREYKYSKWDTIMGCIITVIIASFIIIACAATLYRFEIRIESASDAALALKPLAGKYFSYIFAFGLFNASLFAASILPLATAYSVCEGMGWEAGVKWTFKEAPIFLGLYTCIIVIGAGYILIPKISLLWIMVTSQVLNGILLPFVLIFMLILINDRRLMGNYINTRRYNIIAWITIFAMIIITLILTLTTIF